MIPKNHDDVDILVTDVVNGDGNNNGISNMETDSGKEVEMSTSKSNRKEVDTTSIDEVWEHF